MRKHKLTYLVSGAVIVGAAILMVKNDPPNPDFNNVVDAEYACKAAVRDRLTAPDSAAFDWGVGKVYSWRKGEYRINGGVDSQNGLGAKIRTGFTCSVEIKPDRKPKVTVIFAR